MRYLTIMLTLETRQVQTFQIPSKKNKINELVVLLKKRKETTLWGLYTAFVEKKIALTHVIFLWFYFMVSFNHVSIFFATNSYKTSF